MTATLTAHDLAATLAPVATRAVEQHETSVASDVRNGAVTGGVRTLLALESVAILAVMLGVYNHLNAGWGLFAALFLLPDLAMLPYLKSRSTGAAAYNAAHTYIAPALILGVAWIGSSTVGYAIATIWAAHIAFDRAMGYGLKYATGFNDTHLGRVGRGQPQH